MKNTVLLITAFFFALSWTYAQDASIAKSLGLYVFPSDEQTKDQQEYDEFQCYKWAKAESDIDPMNIDVQAEETEAGPDGSAVVGAAKGAAVGAAIGAVTGDAGKGAAIGAISGGAGGLGKGRRNRAAKKQQAENQAAQQEAALFAEFQKAFSVCMEGKGYTIK